jgi:hypothetical protein
MNSLYLNSIQRIKFDEVDLVAIMRHLFHQITLNHWASAFSEYVLYVLVPPYLLL